MEMIIVRNAKIVKIVGTLCLLLDCVECIIYNNNNNLRYNHGKMLI